MNKDPKKLSTNARKIQKWEQSKIEKPRFYIAQLFAGPNDKFWFGWPREGTRPATENDRKIVACVAELLEITHSHYGRQSLLYVMSQDGTAVPIPRTPIQIPRAK
jgi:hypothetical protein